MHAMAQGCQEHAESGKQGNVGANVPAGCWQCLNLRHDTASTNEPGRIQDINFAYYHAGDSSSGEAER